MKFFLDESVFYRLGCFEAIVRTPQQRRRYILKQDVARYGPTPGCEACTTLAAGAQRVTKPHSDECRARMEELMQRDEDALVQQRLHTDRLRRGSTVVEASEDERRNPDVEITGSVCRRGAAEKHLVAKAHENPREQKQRLRGVISDAAAKMMNAAVKCELTSAERSHSQTNQQVMASIQLSSST